MTADINVIGFRQNTLSNEADVMSSGRLFHSFGPTKANDWLSEKRFVQFYPLQTEPLTTDLKLSQKCKSLNCI